MDGKVETVARLAEVIVEQLRLRWPAGVADVGRERCAGSLSGCATVDPADDRRPASTNSCAIHEKL